MSSCCFLIYHSGSCSCRQHLTLRERQQCLAKPDLPVFTELCLSIHQVCCAHSPATLCSLASLADITALSLTQSVFSSLTTQMKEELEETVILPPHTALHFTVTALLSSTKSPSFSCSERGKRQQFYSTFNNTETGI